MATTTLFVIVIITSVLAYPINARSLIAMKAKTKASADEQNEYFQHPFSPFFGGFGGARGAIRPPFGLGAGIGGSIGGAFGSGFGPFAGNGGTSSAGTGTGSGSGFGSGINEGFGDSGGNNPNDKIEGERDAGDLGEGGDATIKNDMHHH
ncbi:glycine-rich protein 5-like [Solanum stenotomum]|uniref:glycine-rich protein 5-like n=1 Tax=Solanum stenotomum TaxID=172797 RepID=UPI0020D07842|nr:glycine-rich protein 5-like [Solanum stenotomum]